MKLIFGSAGSEEGSRRLDQYLQLCYPEKSRSHIQNLIRSGSITVNGNKVKSGYSLREGDIVDYPEEVPDPGAVLPSPRDIPIDIV